MNTVAVLTKMSLDVECCTKYTFYFDKNSVVIMASIELFTTLIVKYGFFQIVVESDENNVVYLTDLDLSRIMQIWISVNVPIIISDIYIVGCLSVGKLSVLNQYES